MVTKNKTCYEYQNSDSNPRFCEKTLISWILGFSAEISPKNFATEFAETFITAKYGQINKEELPKPLKLTPQIRYSLALSKTVWR